MENTGLIITSIGLFVLLLVMIVLLRYKLGSRFEIKNPDIVLALLPIVIWLLLSGKITSFQLGDLKFETAFKKAKNEAVVNQIYQIPITTIRGEDKGTFEQLDIILASKPEALKFVIGNKNYFNPLVAEYLKRFAATGAKYIVFENKTGEFIGLIKLNEINRQLFEPGEQAFSITEFVMWMGEGNIEKITSIGGLIPAANSVTEKSSKQLTLELMEKSNSDIIPVLDNRKKLIGVVERSRLTASLLLDVSKALDKE